MFKLRDYQSELHAKIMDAWQTFRAVLAVLSTGGGKTVIFTMLMHNHKGSSAAIVHRKEIVSQISCSLANLEVKHRIIAPPATIKTIRKRHLKLYGKSFIDPHSQAGVISVQTITSRSSGKNKELQRWLKQVTLTVFDEGHHYVKSGIWGRAVEAFTTAKLLFVTATPKRADGKGLGIHADGFCETMVEGPSTKWLIEQAYLCAYKYYAPDTDLDVSNIPLTKDGDINTRRMRARITESHLVGDVVAHYQKFAPGKRAIVFANDVETAVEQAAAFNAAGISAVALSGNTDQTERDYELDRFESGQTMVLVNVDLFDEGFDVPAVEAVIMARVTESLAKFLQMIGRGLRPVYAPGLDLTTVDGRLKAIEVGGKPHAIIIDAVRNWERGHGMPDWPRNWTLDSRDTNGRNKQGDTIPQKVCTACTQPYEAFHTACPYCGHVPIPAGRATPEQVEGDLTALDTEAMAALFEKIRKADIDESEYRESLFEPDENGNIIPPQFHGQQVRRHMAAKHRREVLRNLVAWWLGMQPAQRSKAERWRRFYYRFGIDIGEAFALNAEDTDALIAKITDRFGEDIAA